MSEASATKRFLAWSKENAWLVAIAVVIPLGVTVLLAWFWWAGRFPWNEEA